MPHKHYAKLGGDLTYACQRLAEGVGAVGVVVVLARGMTEEAEVGMTFAPGLRINPGDFRGLTDEILKGSYSASISKADKACTMLAEATRAECVILFVINKDGTVRVNVSQPKPNDFVAAFALQIANSFDAMN
jgi:hypothetical protein